MLRIPVKIMVATIRLYQICVSPWMPPACRFTPTCSDYAIQAFKKHGFIKGIGLTIWRLCRCQPFCKGGFDPVPEKKGSPS